jgi:hypothetical protein
MKRHTHTQVGGIATAVRRHWEKRMLSGCRKHDTRHATFCKSGGCHFPEAAGIRVSTFSDLIAVSS